MERVDDVRSLAQGRERGDGGVEREYLGTIEAVSGRQRRSHHAHGTALPNEAQMRTWMMFEALVCLLTRPADFR